MSNFVDKLRNATAGSHAARAPKAKGLRTHVRAGDNPGMGPYNGDLVCITRQDGKTIMACYYD